MMMITKVEADDFTSIVKAKNMIANYWTVVSHVNLDLFKFLSNVKCIIDYVT